MLMPIFRSFILVRRSFIKIQNNVDESESPCLTLLFVSNQSVCVLFNFIHAVGFTMILLHHKYDDQYYSVGTYNIIGLCPPSQTLLHIYNTTECRLLIS